MACLLRRVSSGSYTSIRALSAATLPEPIRKPEVKYVQHFINNEWVESESKKTLPVINPTTGDKICEVAAAEKPEIDKAVAAARDAFRFGSPWRRMDASQRGRLLYKLADLIEQDRRYLASLETLNNGKPYTMSYDVDVPSAYRHLRYCAGMADKIEGKVIPCDGTYFCYTRPEPKGVVGQIITWTFPLLMQAYKLGPALAAGCTVVLKTAEQTPLTALYVAHLVKQAGFPPGVVNIVCGDGPTAGAALASHPDVDKITFTGSTATGMKVAEMAVKSNLKRVCLELGGKSPNVILGDCDFDYAVEMAHYGLFYNQGQCCSAGSRTYVEESIYDKFVEASVALAKMRPIGDPFNAKNEHGPQIDDKHMKIIKSMIDTAKKEGAIVMTGGNRVGSKGFFFAPTVLTDIKDEMTIAREEVFGPVMQLMKFKRLDDVIERANNTSYGLAAAVFSRDVDKINYLTQSIRAGTIWVNCYHAYPDQAPSGGFKMSGWGREKGKEGIEEYTESKCIFVKVPQKSS